MTAATATKQPIRTKAKVSSQSRFASKQSRFATSKLIQNLGSANDGIQFSFFNGLRTAHGRD